MILGVAVTGGIGILLSQFLGRRPTKPQIRGLVVGVGELGEREVLPEIIPIPEVEDPTTEDARWQ
jgi:hypothetical protein